MIDIWRHSSTRPGRIHLAGASGFGRCGAELGPPPELVRCAVCVLLSEGADRPQPAGTPVVMVTDANAELE